LPLCRWYERVVASVRASVCSVASGRWGWLSDGGGLTRFVAVDRRV
jgi:hypothetical protein